LASEVIRELPSDLIEAARCAQDARADSVGESLQYMIMVLAVVRDPDQALVGRRQEQRADRRIHRPVGDIKQLIRCSGRHKLIMEPSHRLGFVGVDRGEYGITEVDHERIPPAV
jgi:hypothetical protein